MKEYKTAKTANVLEVILSWVLVLLLGYLFALITKQNIEKYLISCGLIGAIVDFSVFRKHLKRKVILKETSIEFRSYHINRAYRDAEIDYSSVERIGKCFSFNIKGTAMYIRVPGYEKDILIDATMENHKELFSEICKRVKECNPDVKISKKIIEYLSD